ncbi:MAG TPA: flippase-like domain-containing protein [Terriglobia bacterium]|nr:flippase-like domain-containing protein [Terriglobia bacterium]
MCREPGNCDAVFHSGSQARSSRSGARDAPAVAVFQERRNGTSLPVLNRLRAGAAGFGRSVAVCLKSSSTVVPVVFYSVVFHLLVVLASYVIFLSIGVRVSFWDCLLFVPIISAVQMLPVSISGFGVREGASVYLFGSAGVSTSAAVASSLLFWSIVALVSLPGGIVFALRKGDKAFL